MHIVGRLWIFAGALLLVATSSGCTLNPATGRRQLLLLSTEEEIALGAEAKPELINEYGGQVESTELREYVSTIGHRLSRYTEVDYPDLPWEFIVLDSPVINAFALPGGKVFVSKGLLSHMDNEAQLAAVLGHEIGHVTAQHTDERVSQSMVVQGVAQAAGTATEGQSGWLAQTVPLIVGLGGQGYLLSFSRDQESEADRLGLEYMTRAGYDPQGMQELIQILINTSQGSRPPEVLSTHPDPQRRLEEVNALIQAEYADTLRNPAFQLHENRFERRAAPHLPPPVAN